MTRLSKLSNISIQLCGLIETLSEVLSQLIPKTKQIKRIIRRQRTTAKERKQYVIHFFELKDYFLQLITVAETLTFDLMNEVKILFEEIGSNSI